MMGKTKTKLIADGDRRYGWYWWATEEVEQFDSGKCGKWMHFFENQQFAIDICKKAITEGVCWECKCTDMALRGSNDGVICFYINGDDWECHKKVINFMIENNLIPKTKSGRFYNNSFKFDNQTRAGEYGADFDGKIKLVEFIDLNTGEWIR